MVTVCFKEFYENVNQPLLMKQEIFTNEVPFVVAHLHTTQEAVCEISLEVIHVTVNLSDPS